VKYCLFILAATALGGAALAVYLGSVRSRAHEARQSADDASQRFDFTAAQAHLTAYLELHPSDAASHLLAARCARRAEFTEHYTGPNAELAATASRHLDTAERLGAAPEEVALERMFARAQHGDLAGTESTLMARVNQQGPDAPLILEALIHGYLRRLQFEKALAGADSLLNVEPNNVLALVWRGRIRDQNNQAADARQDFETAVQALPDFEPARYYLAENLLRANQAEEATAHLEFLNAKAPDNLLVRLAWAKCRIALGDDAQGQSLLDEWLADAPKNHPRLLEALIARTKLALASGRFEEAEGFARRALQESPLDRYALYDLAQSLNGQGRKDDAQAVEEQLNRVRQDLRIVAQCKERLAQNPDNLDLRHEIGATYLRLGRPGEALVWLNSVLERDTKHRPTLQTLAEYYSKAGDEAKAAELRRRLSAGS
jgi:predicted Zn-dependent protease